MKPGSVIRAAFDEAAARSECRLVSPLADAGVGKSRLVEAFTSSLAGEARIGRGRCLPYGKGITFWPLVELVRDAAGVGEDDPPDAARAKLALVLTTHTRTYDRSSTGSSSATRIRSAPVDQSRSIRGRRGRRCRRAFIVSRCSLHTSRSANLSVGSRESILSCTFFVVSLCRRRFCEKSAFHAPD